MTEAQTKLNELFKLCDKEIIIIFNEIMHFLKTCGSFKWEQKQGSVHCSAKTVFLALHPKQSWMDITIACPIAITHPKLKKTKQVDKNRYHLDFRFLKNEELDQVFFKLLKSAYMN